jgi:uncharacterized repeat protein (TIGR01451 family)
MFSTATPGHDPTRPSPTTRKLAMLGRRAAVVAAGIASSAGLLAVTAPQAAAAPIVCTTGSIFIGQGAPTQFSQQIYGAGSTSFVPLGPATNDVFNAIGYRETDQSLYTINTPTSQLHRVEPDGSTTLLGDIAGLPDANYNSGAFDPTGDFYITSTIPGVEATTAYRVDVDTLTATAIPFTGGTWAAADWTYKDGYFWGVAYANSSVAGQLQRFDPATGAVDSFAQTVLPTTPSNFTYGAAWTYGNGNLGFSENATGSVSQVALSNATTTPTLTLVSRASGPASANNDGAACVGLPADLSVDKSGPLTAELGEQVTYTITVTNNGTGGSSGSTFTDVLPAGLGNPTTTAPGCTIASGVMQCVLGQLAPGESTSVDVSGTMPGTFSTEVENTASIFGNEQDPDPTNNTDTHTITTRDREADLSLAKSAPGTVDRGGQITWNVDVTNNGRDASTGSTVVDSIPAGVTNVATSTPGCTVTVADVTCDVGALAVGETTRITLTGNAPSTFSASVVNSATVTGDDPDPVPTNNTGTSTTVTPPPPNAPAPRYDVSMTKTASDATVTVGDTVTYSLVARNLGPDAAPGVVVTDTVPSELDVQNVSSSQGTCTVSGNRISCAVGTLAPGQTVTVTVRAKAIKAGATTNVGTVVPPPLPPGTTPVDPPANNTDDADVTIAKKPTLGLTKTANRRTIVAGQRVVYTIRVKNPSKGTMRNVKVCDDLPSGLVYVGSKSRAKLSKGQYCWTVKRLAAGKSKSFTLTARALRGTSGTRANRATATSPDAVTKRASRSVRVRSTGLRAGGVTG